MIYTSGWIDKNLGISRDAIRYYKDKGLLHACGARNPINNRLEFEEKDVDRIWSIKVLIDIGYSAEEIKEIMYNPNFDFYASITQKAAQLEDEFEKNKSCLEFVKTIKLTGRIPIINEMGSIKYDDFIKKVKEHWNIYADPEFGPYMSVVEKLHNQKIDQLSLNDIEGFVEFFEKIDQKIKLGVIHGYFQILSDMRDLDPTCETVQRTVRLLLKHWMNHVLEETTINSERIHSQVMYLRTSFIAGPSDNWCERLYGKDGCAFIAEALNAYTRSAIDDM